MMWPWMLDQLARHQRGHGLPPLPQPPKPKKRTEDDELADVILSSLASSEIMMSGADLRADVEARMGELCNSTPFYEAIHVLMEEGWVERIKTRTSLYFYRIHKRITDVPAGKDGP